MFRASAPSLDADEVREAALGCAADLVILRIPAGALPVLAALDAAGLPVIVADTLVRYRADLEAEPVRLPRNADLEFAEAGAAELASLVRRIFPAYVNHYRANPLLPAESILEGYVEWAVGAVGARPDAAAWVVRRAGEAVGFMTCSFSGDETRVALNGVVPAASDQGIYRDLLRFLAARSRERGCRFMLAATQVQNFQVQAAWAGEGFGLRGAEVTLHLNTLFEWVRQAPCRGKVAWSREQLGQGASKAARRAIDAVVADFQVGSAVGPGAAPLTVRHLAVSPLQAGEPYRIWFRAWDAASPSLAVLQVADAGGRIVHQAYYTSPVAGAR